MQSTLKKSLFLFSALMACISSLSAAPYQAKPLSCRADNGMEIVQSTGAVASMVLGKKYEFAEGVNQDNSQAFEWYCNAAMQNNAQGQLKIALFLLEGKGKQRDVSNGLAWLNRAVNNGSHDAELALGILLVDTDAVRGAMLFKRAALGGNLYANHRLAELYYSGIGIAQNYNKAQELAQMGVTAGFEKSKQLLIDIQAKQALDVSQPAPMLLAVESAINNKNTPSSISSSASSSSIRVAVSKAPAIPQKPREARVSQGSGFQDYVRDVRWIKQQSSKHYTIQLVQVKKVQGIFTYIKKYNFDNNAYYIHAQQGDKYRYILLYGSYPNNQMSKAVAKTLPAAVQKAGYWIRTFGDLRRSYVISP